MSGEYQRYTGVRDVHTLVLFVVTQVACVLLGFVMEQTWNSEDLQEPVAERSDPMSLSVGRVIRGPGTPTTERSKVLSVRATSQLVSLFYRKHSRSSVSCPTPQTTLPHVEPRFTDEARPLHAQGARLLHAKHSLDVASVECTQDRRAPLDHFVETEDMSGLLHELLADKEQINQEY